MGGISSVIKIYRSSTLFSHWPITYVSTHSDGEAIRKLWVAGGAVIKFLAWLVHRQSTVLHVHSASRASFWRKCIFILPALLARKRVLFHLHGGEFVQFYENECGPTKKRFIRYVLDRCTKIIALSEAWRESLSMITKNASIAVVPNPTIDWSQSSDGAQRQPAALLFLGRLAQRKGIYVLLEALAEVRSRHPQVKLLCGGDGELDKVRSEVERLGLEDNVEILGWVYEPRKKELLNVATVYVLPSFAEGVPMSILEAMAAGLPVISTPVGGIADVITHRENGMLVTPGSVTELSEAISTLLENADMRAEIARNAHATFLSSFSVETVVSKIESIYRDLGVEPLQTS
jgi:glycosyltransferase involved in cell wall biosynthesis